MKPAYPKGWLKTIDDLFKGDGQPSSEEIEWARAYEKEQLKKSGARFPLAGEIYEALHNVEVICMTHWRAPFTGGENVTLPAGTRIKAEVSLREPEPVGIYAIPVDYERLETVLVPLSDRESEKYAGYSVSVKTAQLSKDFRLVSGQET